MARSKHSAFKSATAEAAGIAEICRQLVEQEELLPGDILILLRNDPRGIYSAPIIEALGEQGLAAERPVNPFAVLEDDYPRTMLCMMRLLRDREDGLAWRELLKLRPNNIGDGSLMAVYRLADEHGERYQKTLALIADDPNILVHPRRSTIASEVEAIEEALDGLGDALELGAAEGLEALLDASAFPLGAERELVTDLLLRLMAEEEGEEEPKLKDIETALHSSRGSLDEAERDPDPDSVQIMTMHSAKGLTAEAVVVAACDDQLVPGETKNKRELDDERRLLYVSLTRAKHFLFVTYARKRLGRQSHMMGVSEDRGYTRFLQDYLPPTAH
jgi:DNA helicase-2/ATP-dependent DNA helicase PcrA